MCSLQNWHFPLKKQYEIIGIFVYQFNLLLHFGHFEGGKTMLSPESPRSATTFKKLPIQAPVMNTKIAKTVFKSIIMCYAFFGDEFKKFV